MKRPLGDWLVLAGGVLVTLSSGAHAFAGWPGLAAELDELTPSPELRETVAIGTLLAGGALLGRRARRVVAVSALPGARSGRAA